MDKLPKVSFHVDDGVGTSLPEVTTKQKNWLTEECYIRSRIIFSTYLCICVCSKRSPGRLNACIGCILPVCCHDNLSKEFLLRFPRFLVFLCFVRSYDIWIASTARLGVTQHLFDITDPFWTCQLDDHKQSRVARGHDGSNIGQNTSSIVVAWPTSRPQQFPIYSASALGRRHGEK